MTEAQKNTVRDCGPEVQSVEILLNGLARVHFSWGWLYLNEDGSTHSKQYRSS